MLVGSTSVPYERVVDYLRDALVHSHLEVFFAWARGGVDAIEAAGIVGLRCSGLILLLLLHLEYRIFCIECVQGLRSHGCRRRLLLSAVLLAQREVLLTRRLAAPPLDRILVVFEALGWMVLSQLHVGQGALALQLQVTVNPIELKQARVRVRQQLHVLVRQLAPLHRLFDLLPQFGLL